MVRGTKDSPFHCGDTDVRDAPRMATSGAFTIGVNAVPPIPPRLEIVNVAPCMASMVSFLSRAAFASSPHASANSTTPI